MNIEELPSIGPYDPDAELYTKKFTRVRHFLAACGSEYPFTARFLTTDVTCDGGKHYCATTPIGDLPDDAKDAVCLIKWCARKNLNKIRALILKGEE